MKIVAGLIASAIADLEYWNGYAHENQTVSYCGNVVIGDNMVNTTCTLGGLENVRLAQWNGGYILNDGSLTGYGVVDQNAGAVVFYHQNELVEGTTLFKNDTCWGSKFSCADKGEPVSEIALAIDNTIWAAGWIKFRFRNYEDKSTITFVPANMFGDSLACTNATSLQDVSVSGDGNVIVNVDSSMAQSDELAVTVECPAGVHIPSTTFVAA